MIAQHFVSAVLDLQGDESAKRTAVLSYNARGVGRSQGSKGWFGLATGVGTADFAVVEAWVMGVMDVKEVRRFVSSHFPVLEYS